MKKAIFSLLLMLGLMVTIPSNRALSFRSSENRRGVTAPPHTGTVAAAQLDCRWPLRAGYACSDGFACYDQWCERSPWPSDCACHSAVPCLCCDFTTGLCYETYITQCEPLPCVF